jgi:peptidoglycan hydrolase-like protein with peptidoglycan-binding domain
MFAVALGAVLTAPATADILGQKLKTGVQKTKDDTNKAEDNVEDKATDMKDPMLGRKTEGPEDHHGAMKNHDVMAAQQALKDKGSDPGMIDGKMGPRTHSLTTRRRKA